MDATELTQEELALLHGDQDATATPASLEAAPALAEWAHGRQDPTVLRRELEVLESYFQDIASRFADALSRGLQRLVEVQLTQVGSMAYSQYAFSRANPTCYVVVSAHPLPTSLALEIGPDLLFPILDCLLGGGKRPCPIPNRPPTELEQRLAQRMIRLLLDEMHDAWEPLLAVDLCVDRLESHAQRVRVVAPGEAVVVLTFRARVAEQTGEMTWCLPLRAIRKIVDKLLVTDYNREDRAKGLAASGQRELVAYFEAESITDVELDNLRVGDVLLSDVHADGLIDVMVDGEARFRARPGTHQGRLAIAIAE